MAQRRGQRPPAMTAQVHVLAGAETATRDAIDVASSRQIIAVVKPGDQVVLLLVGHGSHDGSTNTG